MHSIRGMKTPIIVSIGLAIGAVLALASSEEPARVEPGNSLLEDKVLRERPGTAGEPTILDKAPERKEDLTTPRFCTDPAGAVYSIGQPGFSNCLEAKRQAEADRLKQEAGTVGSGTVPLPQEPTPVPSPADR